MSNKRAIRIVDYITNRLGTPDLMTMTQPQIRGRMKRIRNLIGDCLRGYSVTSGIITDDDPREFLNSDEAILGYIKDLERVRKQTLEAIEGLSVLICEYRCCREVIGSPDQSFEPIDDEYVQAFLEGGLSKITKILNVP